MKRLIVFTIALAHFTFALAQKDSLILKNSNVIVGELKNMDRAVATMETPYSNEDFKIEWDGIKKIFTQTTYLVTTKDGERFNGSLHSVAPDTVKIVMDDGESIVLPFMDIVFLKEVDKGFKNRINAFVDVGFDLTKANNVMTLATSLGFEFIARRWLLNTGLNTNITTQSEGPNTNRTDGSVSYNYFLPKSFYLPVSVEYLKSSEQQLNSRWTGLVGAGYYIIRTNQKYWGMSGGFTYNLENYAQPDSTPDYLLKRSVEAYIASNLNLFDIGDFSLYNTVKVFPGLTEAGRWRVDLGIDTKYDLPLEFYIKVSFYMNYDNQPVEGGSELDYTLQTGVGWKWP